MKTGMALLLTLLMLALPATVLAQTGETVSVYVTIADGNGDLALAQEPVAVTDADKDGALTIHDALYAAHEAHYQGGAAAGYAASASAYGMSLDRLWGTANGGSYGYYLNDRSAQSLVDPVQEGDHLCAYAFTDLSGWSDTYSYFDAGTAAVRTGEALHLTLSAAGCDAAYNPVTLPVENAVITLNGEATAFKTDKDGRVTLTIDRPGDYVISARSDAMTLVPPVCRVTVTGGDTADAQRLLDGILAHQLDQAGATSVQEWINDTLAPNAGITAEWYAIGLSQYGSYDLSDYQAALRRYLDENEVDAASTRQKYALTLIATGSTDGYIESTLNDSIGQQGVMSWVYGLHLLNNGYQSREHTLSSVKTQLLSLQLADGGWAVMGTAGDVDVTAMAVQALAPHYADDDTVRQAVDKALSMLSARQLDTGDYAGYGLPNPESTAQVMVALSSLGLDCQTDSRFIKTDNTLFDGLRRYARTDGSFCHEVGGAYSDTATAQVFSAMVAYLRMAGGNPPLYLLDNAAPAGLSADDSRDAGSAPTHASYKLWVSLAILAVAVIICVVLYLTKQRQIRHFILVLVVAALAIGVVCGTNIQTVDDFHSQASSADDAVGSVTLTIRCDTVAGQGENAYIPADGIILAPTELPIGEGDTVYDVLVAATAAHRIHLETSGSGGAAYVQGIQHLYEMDFGDLSGWVFHVNGEAAAVGCGAYPLADGDRVEWLYSRDLGEDVL